MIRIQSRATGLKKLIAHNQKAIAAFNNRELIKAIKDRAVYYAKYRGPRDTGRLVRSIHGEVNDSEGFSLICDAVNAKGVAYPEFLEYGTRFIPVGTPENPIRYKSTSGKTAHRPYMAWALYETKKKMKEIINNTIKKFYD